MPGTLWRMLPFIAAAVYLTFVGTPWENTLQLASENRIDLKVAFFYRFREANLLGGFGFAAPAVSAFLAAIGVMGSRIMWISLCLATGALLAKRPPRVILLMLLPLTFALAFGEAFFLWSLLLALFTHGYAKLRQKAPDTTSRLSLFYWPVMLFSLAFVSTLIFTLANPLHALVRHKVLAGKSVIDRLQVFAPATRISVTDSCAALINPDDLRGINAIEKLAKSSLQNFSEIRLLDLKIVERNYALLKIKNERGEFVFSGAARNFGHAEMQYAATQQQFWQTASQLCLIAVFDTPPEKEEAPYSRARVIFDMRKSSGKETKIIQLPAH